MRDPWHSSEKRPECSVTWSKLQWYHEEEAPASWLPGGCWQDYGRVNSAKQILLMAETQALLGSVGGENPRTFRRRFVGKENLTLELHNQPPQSLVISINNWLFSLMIWLWTGRDQLNGSLLGSHSISMRWCPGLEAFEDSAGLALSSLVFQLEWLAQLGLLNIFISPHGSPPG